jgi:glyoxylase-like metal-dependent hydrolase (beta-lactamase superfamily II)
VSGTTLRPHVHLVGGGAFGISSGYDCHVYLISAGDELALVDAGVGLESDRILDNVRSLGFDPSRIGRILLTHAHSDHAGGTADLARATGATVIAVEAEAHLLREGDDHELGLDAARQDGTYPPDYRYTHWTEVTTVEGGRELTIGGLPLRVIEVPGHSVSTTCYLLEADGYRALFGGDVVFAGGFVSLINVPGSDPAAYRRDLPKLAGLGVDGLFPGHQLFVLEGAQRHIDLAIRRMELSVVPNLNLSWLPPPPAAVKGA